MEKLAAVCWVKRKVGEKVASMDFAKAAAMVLLRAAIAAALTVMKMVLSMGIEKVE
jgi:hypothetical protein